MKLNLKTPQLFDHIAAAVLMVVILMSLAFIVATWIVPWGCYTRADRVSSLWGCVVPGLTILSSLFLAFILPTVFFIANKTALPLPDRWYTIAFGSALLSQMVVSTTMIAAAMPLHAGLTYMEVAFVPHGFIVGFGCGFLYWLLRLSLKQIRQLIQEFRLIPVDGG